MAKSGFASFLLVFVSVFFSFFVLIPAVDAKEYHMHLLAVRELGNNSYEGSPADLYLEIVPGSGHIFIETFPVTKTDTQLSTRFAKEVACSYLDVDCGVYDFKYRIKADTSIIGGPSAGASLAALTVAALKGIDLNESVAVTGTINSGGIVGPVGALNSKLDSAVMMNVSKVLVPVGGLSSKDNLSVNLSEYAKKINLSVVEVSDLSDVLYYFSPKNLSWDGNFSVDQVYAGIMKGLAVDLCNRSDLLRSNTGLVIDKNISGEAYNFTNRSFELFNSSNYYAAASYCYRANTDLKYLELLSKNYSKADVARLVNATRAQLFSFEKTFNFSMVETVNDLQAYMIVKERLYEADDYLSKASNSTDLNESIALLSYATERLYSVSSWSAFFGTGKGSYDFDNASVRNACIAKISEAQERIQYGELYFPVLLKDSQKSVDDASAYLDSGDYVLCLFSAGRAKAEVDALISTVGLEKDGLPGLVDSKLNSVEMSISRQSKKGSFPIASYSYYEYAKSLKESDPPAALLYSDYALEFSNLDIYFAKKSSFNFSQIDTDRLVTFMFGFVSGVLVFSYYVNSRVRRALEQN